MNQAKSSFCDSITFCISSATDAKACAHERFGRTVRLRKIDNFRGIQLSLYSRFFQTLCLGMTKD